jgi:hypothetical protein
MEKLGSGVRISSNILRPPVIVGSDFSQEVVQIDIFTSKNLRNWIMDIGGVDGDPEIPRSQK